jgi:hypothetical protein
MLIDLFVSDWQPPIFQVMAANFISIQLMYVHLHWRCNRRNSFSVVLWVSERLHHTCDRAG